MSLLSNVGNARSRNLPGKICLSPQLESQATPWPSASRKYDQNSKTSVIYILTLSIWKDSCSFEYLRIYAKRWTITSFSHNMYIQSVCERMRLMVINRLILVKDITKHKIPIYLSVYLILNYILLLLYSI